jgi:two-component system KDP operon response regulator KdpE
VTKPFGVQEFKARIRATLRRAAGSMESIEPCLRFDEGRLIIDPNTYQVSVQGVEVELSPTEHKLLFYLARNAGQVMTQGQILSDVWGPGYEDSTTNVKVYIRRLRRKIEPDPRNPRYILTQRGVGYCLAKI